MRRVWSLTMLDFMSHLGMNYSSIVKMFNKWQTLLLSLISTGWVLILHERIEYSLWRNGTFSMKEWKFSVTTFSTVEIYTFCPEVGKFLKCLMYLLCFFKSEVLNLTEHFVDVSLGQPGLHCVCSHVRRLRSHLKHAGLLAQV